MSPLSFFKCQVRVQQTRYNCNLRPEFVVFCGNLFCYRVSILHLFLVDGLNHPQSNFNNSVFHVRESTGQIPQTPLHHTVQELVFAKSHVLFNHCCFRVLPEDKLNPLMQLLLLLKLLRLLRKWSDEHILLCSVPKLVQHLLTFECLPTRDFKRLLDLVY